jgi:hypothetical protein
MTGLFQSPMSDAPRRAEPGFGRVAQTEERWSLRPLVAGSNPAAFTDARTEAPPDAPVVLSPRASVAYSLRSIMVQHLWEPKHEYYCQEGNFYARECHADYAAWQAFVNEEGDSDPDLNLVFRWDWKIPTDDDGNPEPLNPDVNIRDGRLLLFFMGQRKARCRSAEVSVCQADEPAVREWLATRWGHLRALWAPLAGEIAS